LHFGGDGRAGGQIALRGPEIPVSRTPLAIKRVKQAFQETQINTESFRLWAQRQDTDYFKHLLQDLAIIKEHEIAHVSKDFGELQDFRVLPLGGGECMGAAQELVSANFSEVAHEREYRRVFQLAKKTEQALDCAEAIARLVAQSLLHVAGEAVLPNSLAKLATALGDHYSNDSLAESLHTFMRELARLRLFYDEIAFLRLAEMQDTWTVLAAYTCRELDPLLDLQASLPEITPLAKVV